MSKAVHEKNARPTVFLYILCALSVISNVISIIVSMLLLTGERSIAFLETIPVIDIITEELKHGTLIYYIIKVGIHLFCIYAIILIAKKLRKGLVYYVLSQMFLLAAPWFFLLSLGMYYLMMITVVSMIFSLFFIILFALYLPKKVQQPVQ